MKGSFEEAMVAIAVGKELVLAMREAAVEIGDTKLVEEIDKCLKG